jgi:hypothetical protein
MATMKLMLTAMIVLVLAGFITVCAADPPLTVERPLGENAVNAAIEFETQRCIERERAKTYTAATLCANAAEKRLLMPLMGNDGDLLERILTYQLVLADAVDRKAMTYIESEFNLRQFQTSMKNEVLRRRQYRKQQGEQEQAQVGF